MNSDATEAALGLLGLSPLNAPQSQPQPQPQIHLHTAHSPSLSSSSIGISIDRKSALNHVQSALSPSLVPLKRKQPSPALPTTTRGISPTSSTTPPATTSRDAQPVKPTPRQSSHPLASSSTPPIKATRPLPNVPTKSSAGTSQRHHQQRPFSPRLTTSHPPQTPPITQLPLTSPSTSQHPLSLPDPPPPPDSDAISCICGFTYDDGFSIACDDCSRWCHAACFGIVQGGNVPEYWKCWVCDPEVEVDKERAVKIQKGRLKAMRMRAGNGANGGPGGAGANGVGGNTGIEEGSANAKPTSRRKASPGVERKPRRGSAVAAAIDGSGNSKKKRRASILSPADPSSSTSIMNPPPSNHASASGHPQPSHASSSRISHPAPSISSHGAPLIVNARPTPVTLPPDVYPHPSTHAQLLRVAKAWRGVTALNPPSPLNINPPPRTYVDGEYLRVDDQGYSDRYGYSMSPLDNTTPVILDEHARDAVLPQTVLKTDIPFSSSSYPHPHSYSHLHPHLSQPPSSQTHTPPHLLRPPSPRYHVASSPSPYPTPPAPNGTHTSSAGPYPTPSTTSHPHTHTWSQHNPHTSTHTKSPLAPTTNTIPASTFLAPYTAAIVPSSAYLADPLNGYAHLGMGKPQVRLVGGGWGVGVDARQVGAGVDPEVGGGPKGDRVNGKTKESEETGTETGKARWARCGCWPNAVVRPVICGGTRRAKKGKGRRHRADCSRSSSSAGSRPPDESPRTLDEEQHGKQHTHDASAAPETDPDQEPGSTSDSDTDPTTLSFALFALRDLRADEEIVLGWEWDDGHAVHMLPALMESPGMFGLAHLNHLRAQFTSILHALSSTFTTCACGSSTRDCAVRVMERVVEGRWPWPGGEMSPSASEYDYSESASDAASERCEDVDVDVDDSMDMDVDVDGEKRRRKKRRIGKKKKVVDLGPLVGVKRGFRTRERVPMSGGWCGVEVVPSSLAAFPELEGVMDGEDEDEVVGKAKKRKTKGAKGKGKERAMDVDDPTALSNSTTKDDDMEVDASSSTLEHTLPPRMRKPWVQPAVGSSKSTPDLPSRDQQQGPEKAEVWGWRSPPGTNGESPLSAGTTGSEKHGQKETGMVEGTVGVSGDEGTDEQETEFDTETEADGVDDTQQMPPPPMPASLDPTTVSSLAHAYSRSASPRVPAHWEKNSSPRVSASWISPQLPTSTSTSTSTARMIQPQNQGTQLGAPATSHSSAPWSSAVQSQQTNTSSAATLSAHTPAQMQSLSRTQGQPHPNAQLPPPTISPSTPFSKLSLHSPDGAPLSPHTSALFASGEALIPPEQPMTSPPPRKPSKPLHVHPQNEASAPAPVSVPVVRIESPTGETMRDTPAEAQHQRKSPPEERLDDENKRMSSAEPHRVRFTSPEVLNGLPALRGRAIVGDNEDAEVDVVGEVGEVAGLGAQDPATREDEHLDAQSEAMDVDVDVAGDKPSDETSGSSPNSDDHVQEAQNHVSESPMPPTDDQRPNQDSNDLPAASHSHPPQALMSPRSQADALSPAQTISTPADGYASDDDTSLVSPGPDPSSYPQTTHSGPGTQQPAREPSPPPPPKVKMSLKDFALRKKKQREEMAAKASMSPMSADGSGLPPSPNVDGKRELAIDGAGGRDEKADNTTDVVNGQDAEMSDGMETFVKEAHVDAGLNGNGMNVEVNGARDEAVSTPRNTQPLPQHQQASPEEHKATDTPIIAPSLDVTLASPPPTRPPTPPPRASSETTKVQTHTQINGRTDPAPITLKAKVEIMDGVMPSGLVGADDHAPDVVSFAPEPPPPPLTSKQANDIGIVKGSAAGASAPTSTPSTPSASTPFLSSRSTSIMSVPAPSHSHPLSQPYSHPSSTSIQPSRRASHEDGEIPSSTPPKTYLPRSHTPPTQPRSFHVPHPPSPSFTPVSSSSTAPSRRPPPPPLSRSPLSNAPGPGPSTISSRPLPSGPRALRGSTSQPLANSYAPSRPPYVGSQYIPRGPSADRDRTDWDRDRQWAASSRSRGRAGSSGWGR